MQTAESKIQTRGIPVRELIKAAERLHALTLGEADLSRHTLTEEPIPYFDHPDFQCPERCQELLEPLPVVHGTTKAPSSALPAYVASLYTVPLLGKSEEAELFLRMNFFRLCAERLRASGSGSLKTAREQAARQFLSLSELVRNRIVRANLRLVVAIAKKFVSSRHGFDELVSEGHLPLIRAAELFNVGLGNRFSTYATWAVRNHLARFVSLQARGGEQIGLEEHDELAQPHVAGSEATHHELERQRQWMTQLLTRLAPRDQQVMRARYGLNDQGAAQTLSEIAGDLGLSKERVRQLVLHALDELRDLAIEFKSHRQA